MIIELPSSASANDFPNNSNSSFKVRLPEKLHLGPGEWKVGLLEAHIPNKFYNVTVGEVVFESLAGNVFSKHQVTRGFYGSIEKLVRSINLECKTWDVAGYTGDEYLQLAYDKTANKVTANIASKGDYTVQFSDDLCAVMGFKNTKLRTGIHTAHRLANMFTGLSYLYVYTNLVRDRMVGDSHSPLLRVIPLHGSYGDATHEFRHVHYIETTAFNSDVVQVDIRTDTGELAPFVDGKVLLTLDLQRHV